MFFNLFKNFEDTLGNRKWKLAPKKHPKCSSLNHTSKVLLPTSILRDLAMFDFQPPFLFEISHENLIYRTKCSVAEFIDIEGVVNIPSWMYEQLNLSDSPNVILEYAKVQKGDGIKLLPHSIEFLEVENPKSELEKGLREYPVLSLGDEIAIDFEDVGVIRFTISAIQPEFLNSIYTVDSDLNVEFDEPLGYQEKLESERTVQKYIKVENPKKVVVEKFTLFLDFDELKI